MATSSAAATKKRISRPWDKKFAAGRGGVSSNSTSSSDGRMGEPTSRLPPFFRGGGGGNGNGNSRFVTSSNAAAGSKEGLGENDDDDDDGDSGVPFVKVDGVTFYSDRFYLTKTCYDDDKDDNFNNNISSSSGRTGGCACGADRCGVPPLLDRSRLVAGLNLRAAILSTFSVDVDNDSSSSLSQHLAKEFPTLLGPDATVPTLVLHGRKGWNPNKSSNNDCDGNGSACSADATAGDENDSFAGNISGNQRSEPQQQQQQHEFVCGMGSHDNILSNHDGDDDDVNTVGTQEEATIEYAAANHFRLETPPPAPAGVAVVPIPITENNPKYSFSNNKNNVHWTEVTPSWIPPPRKVTTTTTTTSSTLTTEKIMSKSAKLTGGTATAGANTNTSSPSSSSIGVSQAILDARQPKMGVHHPKYMLLFETSGSVVVVVSTANLTRLGSVDASWLQRFPRSTTRKKTVVAADESSNTKGASSSNDNHRCHDNEDGNVNGDQNDFGFVLSDFLMAQNNACRRNQLTPLEFVRGGNGTYSGLGWKDLNDMARRFDYRHAQVHLVSVVPGDHEGRRHYQHCVRRPRQQQQQQQQQHRKKRSPPKVLYGRQRVADLLQRLSSSSREKKTRPWLPSVICSENDRLIIQPTSLGGEWNRRNMAQVVRSYLGISCNGNSNDSRNEKVSTRNSNENDNITTMATDQDVMERLDIVWPTDDYIREVHDSITISSLRRGNGDGAEEKQGRGCKSPDSLSTSATLQRVSSSQQQQVKKDKSNCDWLGRNETKDNSDNKTEEAGLFLSSQTFNKIDLSCLSQMVMFEPSVPNQRPLPSPSSPEVLLPPHFKSVARLCENGRNLDYRLHKDYGLGKCQERLAWFLLTSACLSRGAQGEDTVGRVQPGSDAVSYSNFELGVLFCSRLQGWDATDRLYCYKPAHCCSCSTTAASRPRKHRRKERGGARMVHLPIPYCLRPARYQQDADEAEFCETPYFHEISPGTASSGNMKLTPRGAALAAKYAEEAEELTY